MHIRDLPRIEPSVLGVVLGLTVLYAVVMIAAIVWLRRRGRSTKRRPARRQRVLRRRAAQCSER